ncbi:MAG: hypothetical protein QM714_12585 [Nocardioides sp.]|uniref:hypothetical protein n=1 Tax=Nocardioides sp. TaxID=35761 RepID=UPI0039E2CF91
MSRPDWWTWCSTVRREAPDEGAWSTAMVWGLHCWSWQAGSATDAERSRPMTVIQLAELHPGKLREQAVRRRLKALCRAELLVRLKGHSRHNPDVYAPSTGNSVPLLGINTGNSVPELGINTGNSVPELGVNTGNSVPLLGINTGHQVPVLRSDTVPPLAETPSAGAYAYVREEHPGGRGDDPIGLETYELLARAMDARDRSNVSARVAPGWRVRAVRGLAELRNAGWPADQLVERLTARDWRGAGSIGRVLKARIDDLALEPPPMTALERHQERQAAAAVAPCDHQTPGGCAACPWCARGQADDEGVVCGQCAGYRDGLDPPGVTPPLFPEPSGPGHPQ